jgi:hypothetical protein
MKGTLNVNGLLVKYKTKYYKTCQMILNYEAIDVKYKIIEPVKYWFYKKTEVARKEHYFYAPCEEDYIKKVKYFESLLTISQAELEEVLVNVIQDDIDQRLANKKNEMERRAKEKSFGKRFN